MKLWEASKSKAVEAVQLALDAVMAVNPIVAAIMVIIGLTILIVTHWNTVKRNGSIDFFGWFKQNWEYLAAILLLPLAPIILAVQLFQRSDHSRG